VDALVMCGGRGTRLDGETEKPLVDVAGEPTVDRVVAALADSRVEDAYAVVSPQAPETRAHVEERVPLVETPGEGYVTDLRRALDDPRIDRPVLTVAADLPLLDGEVVDRVLDAHDDGSLIAAVPAECKRELGVSADTTFEGAERELAPAGVNVVGGSGDDGPDDEDRAGSESDGRTLVVDDARLAVNVNRPPDLGVAKRLLEDG
jgi:adenosylcobinamide-phosphate guanylyltransferase